MRVLGLMTVSCEMGGIEGGCFGQTSGNRICDITVPYDFVGIRHENFEFILLWTDNKVLHEGMLRFAHSAPCSPKNMLSRPELRSCGATFRVRQSAKDGRSRLQLCPSAPEYRSVNTNKALSSDVLRPTISYSRNGTKV
ncbi:hypothetical protein DINM_020695 [Dirofilaria immitis]|nr:hypothetical protein [Dirofilaria immitis]